MVKIQFADVKHKIPKGSFGTEVGMMMYSKRVSADQLPFKMWLYPLPAVLAFFMWGAIFLSTGRNFALAGVGVMAAGAYVFLLRASARNEWPLHKNSKSEV